MNALSRSKLAFAGAHVVFFTSGVAALIYQVVWERVLFSVFGIDSASVALDVATFLAGLGIGSLAGGLWSRKLPRAGVALFAALEIGVGLFGAESVPLFRSVGDAFPTLGRAGDACIAFALLFAPTAAMGASLPLLVSASTRRGLGAAGSLSSLYFLNTLGAAAGAFLTSSILLRHFGLTGTARVAAILNVALGVGLLSLVALGRMRSRGGHDDGARNDGERNEGERNEGERNGGSRFVDERAP